MRVFGVIRPYIRMPNNRLLNMGGVKDKAVTPLPDTCQMKHAYGRDPIALTLFLTNTATPDGTGQVHTAKSRTPLRDNQIVKARRQSICPLFFALVAK